MISALLTLLGTNILLLLLHIQTSNSFPKPLTAKEEREYLEKKAQGDDDARRILIERNLRLVSHIAKKYYSKTNDAEDLISIGTIGLIKAVDSFDYTKGAKLATYASRCIENEILMYFRSNKKRSCDVYFGDEIESDSESGTLTIEDIAADDEDLEKRYEKKSDWEKVKEYIENMPSPREKKIIILRYGLNNKRPLPQREVAKRLGISRSYVSRIEKRVLEKIKEEIE
ncbi:MAG: RNA polymerase sporulation sigma factor SigK [Eubacterium sp.]|nr:RNA polymerase sporulation sigma factor SigK [Eubacterium sp.]